LFDRLQFVDLARHLLLASCKLVDGSRYLLLPGDDPVDTLPHRVEIERHRVQLLRIASRRS